MISQQTIFSGNKVVFDAMIIINSHGLLALSKLAGWAKGEIVIEKHIRKEAQYSKAGQIDLTTFTQDGSIIEDKIFGREQEKLFYQYLKNSIGKVKIHTGEAACLALAISKGYGLASDEKVVREEFQRKCPDKICVNSWSITDKAVSFGLLTKQEAENLKKGFFYV